MRQYLSTLHKKSPKHKKRFALITSGTFTLLVFAIWALATFGVTDGTLANANEATKEANPFGSLIRGFGASFSALRGEVKDDLNESLEVVNFPIELEKSNTYGQ